MTRAALSSPFSPSGISQTLQSWDRGGFYLTQSLAKAAELHPERRYMFQGQPISCEKIWEKVIRCATWLQRNGVEPGSVVLIALTADHPFSELIALAVTHVGATVSLLPATLSAARFARIFDQTEPAAVFLDRGTASFRQTTEGTLTVWMSPGLSSGDWDEAEIEEVLETAPAWGLPFPGKPGDAAFLVYDESEDSEGEVLSHQHLMKMMSTQAALRSIPAYLNSPGSPRSERAVSALV